MPSLCDPDNWADTPFILKKRVRYDRSKPKLVSLVPSRLGNLILQKEVGEQGYQRTSVFQKWAKIDEMVLKSLKKSQNQDP